MNRMFRTARRTLGWSVFALVSMVIVVLVKGIDPEVQVAFQNLNRDAVVRPPEFYAQAQSATRLDVSSGIRPLLNGDAIPKVIAKPSPQQRLKPGPDLPARETELPSLPPLPITPGEASAGEKSESGPSFVELPEPETPAPESTEIAQANPRKTSQNPGRGEKSPAATQAAPPAADKDPAFVAQLTALQEQLNRMAAAQEQNHLSNQSWLESHQMLHQRELQRKLDGIEAGLRELQAKAVRDPGTAKAEDEKHTQRGTIIRQDKVISSEPTSGAGPAIVRNMLESLAEKSNLNVVFSINVEGDVEMTMQDSAGRPALDALRQIPGYVIEKEGRKIQIPPAEPKQYQREAFLPPIVK